MVKFRMHRGMQSGEVPDAQGDVEWRSSGCTGGCRVEKFRMHRGMQSGEVPDAQGDAEW